MNNHYMNQDEYSAVSGLSSAAFDARNGCPGYHRNISNSPAFRDAYDSFYAAAARVYVEGPHDPTQGVK
jgi:hypothetical protein